jgi:prolyl-tRNA editing enzyme YbaK/EbsC (Cys-tRNA(Pro) deacylase)
MGVTEKISRFLDKRIPYMVETGSDEMESAGAEDHHCEDRGCLAKALAVNVDGKVYMVVIPATEQINLQYLQLYLGARKVRLATETECEAFFSDCDEGAMPIFGSLYGLPVMVPHELTDNEEITFTDGNPRELMRVRLRDFLVTEKPWVCARNSILNKPS